MTTNKSISAIDIALLLKLSSINTSNWHQSQIAEDLFISQSVISKSIYRLKYSGLIFPDGKRIMKLALLEILEHSIKYFFPIRTGALIRGIPTAHSAPPLNKIIISDEHYVWPSATGKIRGQSIPPLYPNALKAAKYDSKLYELFALTDALRIGKAREKELAIKHLKKRILNEE